MTKADRLRVLLVAAVAALTALVFAAWATEKPAEASFPGKNGRIVYSETNDRDFSELFSVNPDWTGWTQLTDLSSGYEAIGGDTGPEWSPDGTKIAFSRGDFGPPMPGTDQRDYSVDIWVVNADGTGPQKVTDEPGSEHSPAWSPNGSRIAFLGHEGEVYVTNADGSGEVEKLADGPLGGAENLEWSPDGSALLYAAYRPGSSRYADIYSLKTDGSGEVRKLTGNAADGNLPDWSPDGTKIVFSSRRDGDSSIYTMNADGSGQAKIPYPPCVDSEDISCSGDIAPVWSPDGRKIVFMRFTVFLDEYRSQRLMSMSADGSGLESVASLFQVWGLDWQSLPKPTPQTKADCKRGGYKEFGFENQGRCVTFVNRAASK